MGNLAVQKLYLFFPTFYGKNPAESWGRCSLNRNVAPDYLDRKKSALPKSFFWSIFKNQKIDQTIDFRAPVGFEIALGVFAARIFLYLNDP